MLEKMFGKKGGPNFSNMNQRFTPNPQGQFNPYSQGPYGNQFGEPFGNHFNQNQFGQNQFGQNPNISSYYPGTQFERLQFEIKENRRRINNLTKRIIRLENYLRIRDNSDYIIEEEQIPSDFSM